MDKANYIYPIQKIFKKIMFFEFFFWGGFGAIGSAFYLMHGKKELIGQILPDTTKEVVKERFSNYQGTTFYFLQPNFFWLLSFLILGIGIEWYFMRWKNKKYEQLGDVSVVSSFLPKVYPSKIFWNYFWWRNAFVFCVIALTQPVFGSKKIETPLKNTEIIIGLDISNSMNVKDLSPEDTRLDIAKRAIVQLINSLNGEKVGICVFAGNAYVQLPLTADYDAAKMYVNEIETDMVSVQGTNIAEAISTSVRMFTLAKNTKAFVLVTDGESHDGNIDAAISLIKEKHVVLSVLGIGSQKGGYIPQDVSKPEFGYKVDGNGKKVISKLNPELIRQLAIKANGFANVSTSAFPDLEQLLNQINNLNSSEIGSVELEVKENHYQLFCVLAIISFVIHCFHSWLINLLKKSNG